MIEKVNNTCSLCVDTCMRHVEVMLGALHPGHTSGLN